MPATPRETPRCASSERRSFVRYNVKVAARCSFERPGVDLTGEIRPARVENISRGGLFVRCRVIEAPGTPVHLTLQPPGRGTCVYVDGRVARSPEHSPHGPGMGIVLNRPVDSTRIQELLAPAVARAS